MEKRRNERVVEGSATQAYHARPQRETGRIQWTAVLCVAVLGLLIIGSVILGIMSLADLIHRHPGETWQHLMTWLQANLWWLIGGPLVVLIVFKVVMPTVEVHAHTAVPRAEAARIREETRHLRDTRRHNKTQRPKGYIALSDALGNYGQVISPTGRVTSLLSGNAPSGNAGINPKHLMDFMERMNTANGEYREEGEVQQLLPPMKSGRELIEDGTVQSALAQGKFVLGYDDTHTLRLMRVVDFFSCILGGIPNSGKSSTAVWLLIQLVWAGVHIILVDPHMNYQDEQGRKGLAQELEPFKFAYLRAFPPCDMDNPGSVLARVKWMKNDLIRRKRPGYVVKASDIVIMVFDEFNSVIEVEEISKELSDDLAYIEREGRKFGLHVMLLGHRWAQQDIGNIKIRTCASTILAHRFNDESQGKILLGQSDGKKVLELDPGFYWLRGILMGALAKIYTPYLEAPDIPLVIDAMSETGFTAFPAQAIDADEMGERMPDLTPRTVSRATHPETPGDTRETEMETPVSTAWEATSNIIDGVFGNASDECEDMSTKENNSPVETAIRETIRRMKEARESDRKIARFVGLSGRKYGMYQQVCRELGFVTEKAE